MPHSTENPKSLPLGRLLPLSARLSPGAMVGVQAVVQIVLWSLVPALLYSSPPLDVLEAYVHGLHWTLTTLKHPALPSWALEASRLLTGAVGWPAYIVSQLFIAATLGCVFLLGRDLLGPVRGAIGTLLLTGVAYFSWMTIEFNHNVALMPLWAAFFLGLWRSVETRRLTWWLVTGVAAALMMYTKLSSALAILSGVIWLLVDARGRSALLSPQPWAAAAISAALVVPLYLSLKSSGFAPLAYAAARAEAGNSGPLLFIGAQALALLGLVALLVIAIRAVRRESVVTEPVIADAAPRVRLFLAVATLVPLALVVGGAMATGNGLRSAWGAAMLSFTGLLIVAHMPGIGKAHVLPTFIGSLCLGVAVPLAFAGVHLWQQAYEPRPPRGSWPRAELAAAARRIWQEETGQPLAYVAGHFWPAGLVAVSGGAMPTIIVDGDLRSTPGTPLDDVRRAGVLILNAPGHAATPETLPGLSAPRKVGTIVVPFRYGRAGQTVTLRYAIVPPAR